jgi:Domain of unknown function (DUF4234)
MPARPTEHRRSIAVCLLLTLVTCGLYDIYWQYRQMLSVNDMLGERKYRFGPWLLLTLLTLGFYNIYHEYRVTSDIARVTGRAGRRDAWIAAVLSAVGLSILVDAIQQSRINAHYGPVQQ